MWIQVPNPVVGDDATAGSSLLALSRRCNTTIRLVRGRLVSWHYGDYNRTMWIFDHEKIFMNPISIGCNRCSRLGRVGWVTSDS